jgi:hypothetical protein
MQQTNFLIDTFPKNAIAILALKITGYRFQKMLGLKPRPQRLLINMAPPEVRRIATAPTGT